MTYLMLPRRFAGGLSKLSQEGSCARAPMDDSHGREECPVAPGARRGRSTAFSKSLLRSDWDSPYEDQQLHNRRSCPDSNAPLTALSETSRTLNVKLGSNTHPANGLLQGSARDRRRAPPDSVGTGPDNSKHVTDQRPAARETPAPLDPDCRAVSAPAEIGFRRCARYP